MKRLRLTHTLAAIATALAFSSADAANPNGGSGSASDVITIDQAKAGAGGVTTGDLAGFPVSISQPGSYRLTSNLVVTTADTTAIVITAPNVTLDLNGFSILGPVTCTGAPYVTACSATGNGDGVLVALPDSVRGAVTVLNGTVRGVGRHGVTQTGNNNDGVRIERVIAVGNGGSGIGLPQGGVIANSQMSYNRYNGVAGYGLLLLDNIVRGNGAHGVLTDIGSAGAHNVFRNNAFSQATGVTNLGGNLCGVALCP